MIFQVIQRGVMFGIVQLGVQQLTIKRICTVTEVGTVREDQIMEFVESGIV